MNHEYEVEVGRRLRALREDAGLTQEALSAKLQVLGCDLTRSALAKIEVAQRHVYPDELAALRTVLGATYCEILPEPTPHPRRVENN